MVKFSKELEAQLIPEWKDAFVNYWQLKKHVKKIKLSRKPKQPQEVDRDFGLSIFDPIRSVAKKVAGKFQKSANSTDIIQKKNTRDVEDGQGGEEEQEEEEHEVYENELVQLFSEEDEVNLFFEKLDEELDKVNRFYKSTEDEFLERGDALEKQLQMLLDLKQILADRHRKNSSSFRGTGGGGASPLSSWPSSARTSNFSEAPTELLETTTDASETDDVIAALERNGVTFVGAAARSKLKSNGKPKTTMRIDIPATTPTRMITAVTATLLEDLVNNPRKDGPAYFVYKKRIQYAEKMIRGAFVELYKGLGLLKTYSSLNMMAFTKILKKFDKVAKRQASTSYLKGVKKSHFISSDKVVRLMDEVESIFTEHFANNDSKKAMKFLKPQHNKESHTITFFVGLFTGSFVTLFTIYAILAHIAGIFNSNLDMDYMETVYPVFSIFTLLSLHLFMYGCNLYMWKGTRINYNFIFESSSSTALKYRDAFLLCTTFMTAVVGAMIVHLLLQANSFSRSKVDAIPGALLLISFAVLVCPIDVFYRSTRFCFIRIMRNIFFSPLYKVLLVDFFMADQLTSQIPLLRHMESTACYYLAGSFKTHQYETCRTGRTYRELMYVISFLPYYWRAMQCARRWFDDGKMTNLANMGKYVSAMVAAGARLTYERQLTYATHNYLWLGIVLVTSLAATVYQLYWDFVQDWGFFNAKSKNPWLRDRLVLKRKSIYYMSIALNLVLRVAWLETVINIHPGKMEKRLLDFFLASLEVIRRGHWNFYRLENEHLNNVGGFRAVKEVPLPFREIDSD